MKDMNSGSNLRFYWLGDKITVNSSMDGEKKIEFSSTGADGKFVTQGIDLPLICVV